MGKETRVRSKECLVESIGIDFLYRAYEILVTEARLIIVPWEWLAEIASEKSETTSFVFECCVCCIHKTRHRAFKT